MLDDLRNRQIVEDVLHCAEEGRNCLLLSERTQHVKLLTELLQKAGQSVHVLAGRADQCSNEKSFIGAEGYHRAGHRLRNGKIYR